MLKPQRGAASVEFHIVAFLALLPLCLGGLQLALLLAENHHLDHAAFQAARHAAMSNGDVDAARRALVSAASILFVDAARDIDGSAELAVRVGRAYAAASVDQLRFSRLRILSPDADAQADFAVHRDNRRVIPNDSLQYRPRQPGRRSGLTLQQANVLRLEVRWCRPLVVPFARQLLLGALRLIDPDAWHQYCYAQGRVPIRSEAASPMQSDFRVSS